VYGWLVVDQFLLPGWMDVLVGGFSLLLAFKLATGFVAIRKML
jgi:hypothetical protein